MTHSFPPRRSSDLQPLGKLLLRPGGNPHRERPGPGAAQPPQSAVMPATEPAGAQSWVAGTRMQLTQAGPRSGSSPGHGLLPPSRTQEIGRAHVRTPVTNAHTVCRRRIEKKKNNNTTHT